LGDDVKKDKQKKAKRTAILTSSTKTPNQNPEGILSL